MKRKIIGILGGMGPAATADMFQKFIQFQTAACDQEHIPLLISSVPDIPDRSACLLKNEGNPFPYMLEYSENLIKAGASCLVMACNTAHYWFDDLKQKLNIPMLSMIECTADAAVGQQKVGLLATNATVATGLYEKALAQRSIQLIVPQAENQQAVMESIYLYKSGQIQQAQEIMNIQQNHLFEQGVQQIILGCTEVPLILAESVFRQPERYLDATAILVRAAIDWYHQN